MNYEFFKKIDWKHVLILILIFTTAFAFRSHILRYEYMLEPDAFWHGRMVGEWLETGVKPTYDLMGTYHNAMKGSIEWSYALFTWGFGYIAYKVFTLGAAYDKDTWLFILRILPPIYGALTSLAMYLLFKWSYRSRTAGYIAGFITATLPGYIYRTFGGHFEEDSLGFLWMALGIAFLIRAVREPKLTRENIIYATLSGLMFGIMAFTWAVFVIVPVIIEAYFILTLLWNLFKGASKEELKAFAILFGICFVITGTLGYLADTNWIGTQINYGKGFLGIEGGQSVDGRSSGVGEESLGFPSFGTKYGVFNIFLVLGVLAGIYALYRKKNDYITMIFLMWGLVTLYLAYNKLKATYWYGLGLAALTSLFLAEVHVYLKSLKKDITLKLLVTLGCFILIAGGVASAVIFVENHSPGIEDEGWKSALLWMKDNTDVNAKIMNWWNYGHWITFISERRVATDNTNGDSQANKDFSTFVSTDDINKALGILKAYDTDYVIFPVEDVAYQQVYLMYSQNLSANDYKMQTSYGVTVPCFKAQGAYICQGNTISESDMSSFYTKYQTKPNNVLQGRLPVFMYTNLQRNRIWQISYTNNNSMAAKMWFYSDEVAPYLKEVYDNTEVRIWKVNKEALVSIEPYMTDLNAQQIEEWNSKLWWLK